MNSFPQYAFRSIRLNQFDNTWAYHIPGDDLNVLWKDYGYFFDDNYHNFKKIPPENIVKGRENWDVNYKYNKDFFRSDEFKNNHEKLHVVFSGCSCTEGLGENIERTWSYMLNQSINRQIKTSGYFNLGKGGNGWHKIISNHMNYVEKFGNPQLLFIILPNLMRNFVWLGDQWGYDQQLPMNVETYTLSDDEKSKMPTSEKYSIAFAEWVVAWSLFIKFCETNGTRVLWSTWDEFDSINIKNSGFFDNTFIDIAPIPESFLQEISGKIIMNDKNIFARDNHPGYVTHKYWEKRFLEELNIRGLLTNEND
jgi:hypothetical protein